ncbi:hypothetical protein I6N90_20310 [Paenibacillus sp. GSMTC-2017]|uniref:hypothetical protein n=1 Tax=Paenibacillus sp. GSMTC-2017 TaxID=2794350 RepID=UPI0018D9984B|nr:hypothetical protein [Paenibacillus sp. GSMTC-2017]MBH5320152.1 hypothetical protein [Paenibacillus sp. GSMTC-2017]
MYEWISASIRIGSIALQFVFAGAAIFALLKLMPKRQTRWKKLALLDWRTSSPPVKWLKLFGIKKGLSSYQERELLLTGCGVMADPMWYMLLRRAVIFVLTTVLLLIVLLYKGSYTSIIAQLSVGVPIVVIAALKLDRMWLRSLLKMRSLQMTKEIYTISNQLLYLSDSTLHIHSKLMRCIPFTKVMRSDLEWLLAEWYHDPSQALKGFKLRIGTDDGMSFVETIDALRQHESGHYYELLRVRIADYKEKIELAKESRKESTSYVLFAIAGIPILYTFQVFIYPWVMEGQKLFQSLG